MPKKIVPKQMANSLLLGILGTESNILELYQMLFPQSERPSRL